MAEAKGTSVAKTTSIDVKASSKLFKRCNAALTVAHNHEKRARPYAQIRHQQELVIKMEKEKAANIATIGKAESKAAAKGKPAKPAKSKAANNPQKHTKTEAVKKTIPRNGLQMMPLAVAHP